MDCVLIRFGLALSFCASLLSCGGGGGTTSAVAVETSSLPSTGTNASTSTVSPVDAAGSVAFNGTGVIGSPTFNSVTFNIHTTDKPGSLRIEFGKASFQYSNESPATSIEIDKPIEVRLTQLEAGTRYFYRLRFQASNSQESVASPEYEFQTARQPGQSFVFAIQGDSHPERFKTQFDPDLYRRTLLRAAADKPDFYILMGDDFSVDTLNPDTVTSAQVRERYTYQRPFRTLIGRTSPL